MTMGGAAKVIVDKAAEEIASASRGKIAVTWLLLSFIGLGICLAVWRFDTHSNRLFAQMAPVNGFSTLMMKSVIDPVTGYETPQIVTWIHQAQAGNQALARVEKKLDAQAVLLERITLLLEQQAKEKK